MNFDPSGILGAIVGAIIGLGVLTVYRSGQNAAGPMERAFLKKAWAICATAAAALALGYALTPKQYSAWLAFPYVVLTFAATEVWSRKQRAIRRIERRDARGDLL